MPRCLSSGPCDKPPLFPVEDLRAAAGMGASGAGATCQAGADAVAAGPTRGQRRVVLTGLVPLEKQEAAYAEVLKQSVFFDPQKDDPDYPGYWVQRVEVNNSGDAANPDWEQSAANHIENCHRAGGGPVVVVIERCRRR